MIHSMTGYAVGDRDVGGATLHLELKSVNSRFLDVSFRCADELRFLEMPLREQIAGKVQRGKAECRVNLLPQSAAPRELAANIALVEQLGRLELAVRRALPQAAPLSVAEVLRWPGVLGDESIDPARLAAEGAALMTAVLDEFVASRAREGAKLGDMLLERTRRMRELVAGVTPMVPQAIADYEQRLAAKLREAAAGLEEDRIRQEIGLFAARIDVAEELSRLVAHLEEVERVVGKGGAVGKRLDFLMQELNREANTLASKSVSAEVTAVALELKLLIEQMREQVQPGVDMSAGTLFIVSAPSGAGKTTLVKRLLERDRGVRHSVSYTTRAPRAGEQDGREYHFIDVARFTAMRERGDFLEWAEVHGNFYGTSRVWLEEQMAAGHDVLLEIDWQGAAQVRRFFPDAVGIFVLPPSVAELERRLRGRGTDSDEVIRRRVAAALGEMAHVGEFGFVIINNDLDTAVADLVAVVAASRLRFPRQRARHGSVFRFLDNIH